MFSLNIQEKINIINTEESNAFNFNYFSAKISDFFDRILDFSPKLVGAILILLFGFWFIKKIINLYDKKIDKTKLSYEVKPFLRSLLNITLKMVVIFVAAELIGIKTSSFVAILAAVGFAVGLALQGSLGNLASGIMILIFRPYKVGDTVEIENQFGIVEEVEIFNTIVVTFDNKTVIIPNGVAIGGIITNLSSKKHLRVDLTVNIPYNESFDRIKPIIEEALVNTPHVLKDPAPFVGIESFNTHNIVLSVRPYSTTENYWKVYYESNRNVIKALGNSGVKVAYVEGMELGEIAKK